MVSETEQLLGMQDPWRDHGSRWLSEGEGYTQVEDSRPSSQADPPCEYGGTRKE